MFYQNVLHELEGKKPFVDSLKIKGERLQQEAKSEQDKQLVKEKGKMCCFHHEALRFIGIDMYLETFCEGYDVFGRLKFIRFQNSLSFGTVNNSEIKDATR